MAKLNKTASGLLYYDDFKEKSLMWTLSPSDANNLAFEEDGLHMKHNKRYVSYTIVEPYLEEYSCIVHLDHKPVNYDDIAGIIVMSSSHEYAECQSYMATGPSELVNADSFKVDIENMMNRLLADSNYVQWYQDDEPIEEALPDMSETPNRVPGEPVDDPLLFVDVKYNWIKFTKVKRKYIFWASVDGYTWIEIGNVIFEGGCQIGFFIYGTEDKDILKNGRCVFKSFGIYNSKYIAFQGISRDYDCEVIDGQNHLVFRTDDVEYAYMINRSNKEILINTLVAPMPIMDGKLRIFPKRDYDTTLMTFDLGERVYGGDTFSLERNIKMFINNQEISSLELYDLGDFYTGDHYIRVDLYNAEDYILSDVKVSVVQYSEYYGGEEEVVIAKTPYGEQLPAPDLEYKNTITFDGIEPSQGRSFFMKLADTPVQDFYMTAHSYRFKIIVE